MEKKLKSLWLQAFPKLWQKFSASRHISSNSEVKVQDDLALTAILYQMMAFGLSEYLVIQQDRIHQLESIEKPQSPTRYAQNAGSSRKPLSPSSETNINTQRNSVPDHLRSPPKVTISSALSTPHYMRTPPKDSVPPALGQDIPNYLWTPPKASVPSLSGTPNHVITPSPGENTSPSMFSTSYELISPSLLAKENLAPSATVSTQAQAVSPIIGKSRKSFKNNDLDMTTWDEKGVASESVQLSFNVPPTQSKQTTKLNASRSLSRKARSTQADSKQRTLFELKRVTPIAVQRDVSQSGEFSGGFRKPRSPKKKSKSNVAVNLLHKIDQCIVAPSLTSGAKMHATDWSEDVTLLEDIDDFVALNIVTQMKCLETQENVDVSISSSKRANCVSNASLNEPSSPSASAAVNIPDEELDIDEEAAEADLFESEAINGAVEVKMEVDETVVMEQNPPYTQVKTSISSRHQSEEQLKDVGNNTLQLIENFNRPISTKNDAINFHDDGKPRTKLEKLILLGQICTLCKQYYDDIRFISMDTQQIEKVMNNCSRHASRKQLQEPLPSTPPDYWMTGMPSTLECVKRGMIHIEPEKYKAKPKHPPRYTMD